MKICVWKAIGDVPTSHAYMARFLTEKGFTPVFCTAKTEEEVVAKAKAFWDAESAKAQGRTVAGRPAPRGTADAVIDRFGKPDPVEHVEAPVAPSADHRAANPIVGEPAFDLEDLLS